MLFGRITLVFVVTHIQSLSQFISCIARHNYFINQTAFGCTVRVGELILILLYYLLLLFGSRFTIQDVYCTLGTHHCNFRLWISQIHISTCRLAGHDDIGSTVCLTGNQGDFGNCCLGVCIHDFRTVANNAVVLLHRTGKKTGNILKSN